MHNSLHPEKFLTEYVRLTCDEFRSYVVFAILNSEYWSYGITHAGIIPAITVCHSVVLTFCLFARGIRSQRPRHS